MKSTMKKALPVLLLATAFTTTSVIAADTKNHTTEMNFEQCMVGEHIETTKPNIKKLNKPNIKKLNKTNKADTADLLKSNADTQTLLSSIDRKISAELDSSMNKINSQIDKKLSKVTSSITAYFSNVLSN